MKPTLRSPFAPLLGILFLPAALAPAATLLSDDFESVTVGTVPSTGWAFATDTTAANVRVQDQTVSAAFGDPNRFVRFIDSNTTATARFQTGSYPAAANTVTTFSFDFFEPSTGGDNALGVGYAINGNDLTSGNLRVRVSLNNGVIGGLATTSNASYAVATAYRLFMVFNDSGAPVDYQGGTIAAGVADVWLRDSAGGVQFVGTVNPTNTGTAETGYSVGFRTFGTDIQTMYLDNVLFETGAAAIPEPSAVLLAGMGALALLRRRR